MLIGLANMDDRKAAIVIAEAFVYIFMSDLEVKVFQVADTVCGISAEASCHS